MEFKKIELEDRTLLEPFTNQKGRWLSDMNFSNMFMWRHSREISYTFLQEHLIVQTRYPHQNPFVFYPLGAGDKKPIIESLIQF